MAQCDGCDELENEVERLEVENARWEVDNKDLRRERNDALEEIERLREVLLCTDRVCECLHHRKGDHHLLGEPCPVEVRIAAVLHHKVPALNRR